MSSGVKNIESQSVDYTQLTEATSRVDRALDAKDLQGIVAAAKALEGYTASKSSISLLSDREIADVRDKMGWEVTRIHQCAEKPLELLRPQEDQEQEAVVRELNEACRNIENSKANVKNAAFEKVKEVFQDIVRELPKKLKDSKINERALKFGMAGVFVLGMPVAAVAFFACIAFAEIWLPLIFIGVFALAALPLLLGALVGWVTSLITKSFKSYGDTSEEEASDEYKNDPAVLLHKFLVEDEELVRRVFLAEFKFDTLTLEESLQILRDDIALYEKMRGYIMSDREKRSLEGVVEMIHDDENKLVDDVRPLRNLRNALEAVHWDLWSHWNEGKADVFLDRMSDLRDRLNGVQRISANISRKQHRNGRWSTGLD